MLPRVSSYLFRFGAAHRWVLVGSVTFLIDYLSFLTIYSANSSVYIANFFSGLLSIFLIIHLTTFGPSKAIQIIQNLELSML